MSAYCVGEPVAGSDVGCPGPPGGSTEMSTPYWRSCVATSARSSSVVGGVAAKFSLLSWSGAGAHPARRPRAVVPTAWRKLGGPSGERDARYRPPAMSHDTWSAVDRYVADRLIGEDAVQDATLTANADGGLPAIDVSPAQGKLLYLLARIQRARRILEVGTLGGYSTIWLARALPAGEGRLVTLEVDQRHAAVARQNVERAGFGEVVDLRVGP